MIMWIAALVLMTLTVVLGYRAGAIRAGFSFIGLVAGVILAMPLAPMFNWVLPLFSFGGPLVPKFGSPIIAFFAVSWVFKALAAFVHRKVDHHYRYSRDDAHRAVWEVMHRRLGACLGALNGLIYFLVFSLVIAVFGYPTIQMGGGESNSKVLSFVGNAAVDLQATHMDKVVASFNPAPEKYFDTTDILGLLHHNRSLIDRLENYPVFAAMAEEPMYRSLGADKELQSMIKGTATFSEIWDNPKVQEVVTNTDLVTKVLEIDVADLKQYLETGVSPHFEKEKLLGRWSYDGPATLRMNKGLRPDVPASTWFRVKNELLERFDDTIFTAFADSKTKLQLGTNMDGKATSYILTPGPRLANGQIVTNRLARWFTTNATYSATGKWSGSAPNYLITLGNKNGTATAEGTLDKGSLTFQFEGKALFFTKLSD